jgi:hypothetical protein
MKTYISVCVSGITYFSKTLGFTVESITHFTDGWSSRAVFLPADQHAFLHVSQT